MTKPEISQLCRSRKTSMDTKTINIQHTVKTDTTSQDTNKTACTTVSITHTLENMGGWKW